MRPVSVSSACGGVYGNYAQTKNMIRLSRHSICIEFGRQVEGMGASLVQRDLGCTWALFTYVYIFSYFLSLVHMSQG